MSNVSSTDVRRWRLDANLSQAELATKLGVSQGLVSAWETGKTQPAEEDLKNCKHFLDPLPTASSMHSAIG